MVVTDDLVSSATKAKRSNLDPLNPWLHYFVHHQGTMPWNTPMVTCSSKVVAFRRLPNSMVLLYAPAMVVHHLPGVTKHDSLQVVLHCLEEVSLAHLKCF